MRQKNLMGDQEEKKYTIEVNLRMVPVLELVKKVLKPLWLPC